MSNRHGLSTKFKKSAQPRGDSIPYHYYLEAVNTYSQHWEDVGAKRLAVCRLLEKAINVRNSHSKPDQIITLVANQLIVMKDFNIAIFTLKTGLRDDPNNIFLNTALAKIYLGKGLNEQGIDLLKPLVKKNNFDVAAANLLAIFYLNTLEPEKAIEFLEPIKLKAEIDEKANSLLAESYLLTGDMDKFHSVINTMKNSDGKTLLTAMESWFKDDNQTALEIITPQIRPILRDNSYSLLALNIECAGADCEMANNVREHGSNTMASIIEYRTGLLRGQKEFFKKHSAGLKPQQALTIPQP